MTDMQFITIWQDALTTIYNRDAFVYDWCLSAIWNEEEGIDVPVARLEHIGRIWDAAQRSIKDIAKAAGLSQRKLAEKFCIPYRTLEDWCTEKRTPPDYVRLMMQECIGIIKRD